jgi:hypothetical protein
MLADMAVATDVALRAAARRLAGRVFLQLGRVGPAKARGTRRLGPSRGLEGDLDLDRTLDAWSPSASRRPGADDIITRTWTAHRRAVCLVVDISGSMQGLAVALAAVAAAGVIVANEAGREKLQPSVLTFSAGVQVLQAKGCGGRRRTCCPSWWRCAGTAPPTSPQACARRRSSWRRRWPTSAWSCCSRTACTPRATTPPTRSRASTPARPRPARRTGGRGGGGPLAARAAAARQTVRRLAEVGPALTRILS